MKSMIMILLMCGVSVAWGGPLSRHMAAGEINQGEYVMIRAYTEDWRVMACVKIQKKYIQNPRTTRRAVHKLFEVLYAKHALRISKRISVFNAKGGLLMDLSREERSAISDLENSFDYIFDCPTP